MTNLLVITALHLAALSHVESADRDAATGRDGEVSRYQIMPEEWRREVELLKFSRGRAALLLSPTNEADATVVAAGIWQKRVATFGTVYRRNPTLQELYLCWHRPARVIDPKPVERKRAERFETVVNDLTAKYSKDAK